VKMKGSRYDVGEPLGYLLSSLQFGLRQERFRETLILEMERMLQQDKKLIE
jgi:UTP--glucose-1-phosphate uridylyltransferase